jgi:hypothetical protein
VQCDILCKISELGYYVTYGYWMAIFRTLTSTQAVACYLNTGEGHMEMVIYYTADTLKSQYRRQYRTRTLKKRYTEDKNIISL